MSYVTSAQLISKLKKEIKEINVHQLAQQLKGNEKVVVVDIREPDEWDQGHVKGAVHIPRGFLELQIENHAS